MIHGKNIKYEDGLNKTIECINYCYNLNKNIFWKERRKHKFDVDNERFVCDLQKQLNPKIFNNIKYLVIQWNSLCDV